MGAGPGKGKPTIGDGWTEGRSERTGTLLLLACFTCLLVASCLSVCRLSRLIIIIIIIFD